MEGNSSDSVSSRGGASFSPRSSQQSPTETNPIIISGRVSMESDASMESASLPSRPSSEVGTGGQCGILLSESNVPSAIFPTPMGSRGELAFSPVRRGPGRPRKGADTNTGASPRGKIQTARVRGGRGRMRSQITGPQFSLDSQQMASSTPREFFGTSGASSVSPSALSPSVGDLGYFGNTGDSAFAAAPAILSSQSSTIDKEQRCAFCYLTQSSRLGQGDLLRHSPTPGFDLSSLPKKSTLLRDQSPTASMETSPHESASPMESGSGTPTEQLTLRINLKQSKVVRPKKKADVCKSDQDPFDEISMVGLPDDIQLTNLFENGGYSWAHHCCASWSDGVVQSETFALLHVDSAVAAAMTQRCAGCGRMGASITCRANGCSRKYHYPCASAYGGFQDIKTLAFLCPYHLDEVSTLPDANAICEKCETVGDIGSQLFCTSCGDHYHANCLEPPVGTSVNVRAGWQCPGCKMCQHCQLYEDDGKMLVCDSCDKGYHVYCMQPPMNTIPKTGWKCKNCRVCSDCGSRTPGNGVSSRWHLNYTICDSCYQQRNKGLFCPLCERAYRHLKLKSMRQCSQCKKHVHLDCIRKSLTSSASESSLASSNASDYVCPLCQNGGAPNQPALSQLQQPAFVGATRESATTPSSSPSVDENEAETEMLAMFMKSEMAGGAESGSESPFPELDVTLGDMDVDGVMQLLEHEETNELPSDMPFSTGGFEAKRGRGGATAGALRKQASVPRKRISTYGRTSSRAKSSSCSSTGGSVRGGNSAGDKRRGSKTSGAGGRGGGGPRAAITALQATLQNIMSNHTNGGGTRKKDDDEYIHTVVVSSNDEFVFCQDLCVICGSIGQGQEGNFILCMQCGQCYHPYCANVNINSAILRRGWRCLDCTVCEGCGRGDDEQHLLLCDDCDVSFHTYCLDPPLDSIPAGPWVCKWCSSCQVCGEALSLAETSSSPVRICSLCKSVIICPLCRQKYVEGEYIIQCESCERWCHCKCDNLTTEETIDKAAERGFKCWYCRPNSAGGGGAEIGETRGIGMGKAVDFSFHVFMDGVSLTKAGLRAVQWRPRRKPIQVAPVVTTSSVSAMSALDDVIDSVHALVTRGLEEHATGGAEDILTEDRTDDQGRLHLDTAGTNENYATPGPADQSLMSPIDKRKFVRPKKYFKVGVGGFVVRQSRQRSMNEKFDDLQEMHEAMADMLSNEDGRESAAGDVPPSGKPKKRKRQIKKPIKLQLEDNYPSYIQEAFFGFSTADYRPILEDVKPSEMLNLDEQESPIIQTRAVADNELETLAPIPAPQSKNVGDKHQAGAYRRGESSGNREQQGVFKTNQGQGAAVNTMMAQQGSIARRHSNQQDPIGEGFDELGEGDDIFPHPMDIHQNEFSNLIDMLMEGDMDPVGHNDGGQRHSPNLETLIDTQDYVGIGEVDTAEMDRLMGNMLDDELRGGSDGDGASRHHVPSAQHQHQQQSQQHLQDQHQPPSHVQVSMIPSQSVAPLTAYHPHQQQQQQPTAQFGGHEQGQPFGRQVDTEHAQVHHPYGVPMPYMMHQHLQSPHEVAECGQDPSRFLSNPMQCPQPQSGAPPAHSLVQELTPSASPRNAPSAAPSYSGSVSPKGETGSGADGKSYLERWEPDESLGERATIAAVLQANMNYPDLRLKYPAWTERAKQIAKLWRLLAPEARQQYVQMARENRAACRQMSKNKKSTSEQPSHQPILPSSPDMTVERPPFGQAMSVPPPPSQMQEFKPPRDPQLEAGVGGEMGASFRGPGFAGFPGNVMTPQSYGPSGSATMPHGSGVDEFKVPQRPPGVMGYQRSDSQPHAIGEFSKTQIKSEHYNTPQRPQDQSSCVVGGQLNQGTYNAPLPYGMTASTGNFEQPYTNQPTDWNRCQPSLLEDFIEMEKRDQRSRQSASVAYMQGEPGTSGLSGSTMVPPSPTQWPRAAAPTTPTVGPSNYGPGPFGQMEPVVQRQQIVIPSTEGTVSGQNRERQHEEWLTRTQQELEGQMKTAETDLNKLRRNKKNMASKQRQLKKNNLELSTDDSNFLTRLTQEIAEGQKQLDHLRKQVKQHNNLVQDYNMKRGLVTPNSTTSSAPPTVQRSQSVHPTTPMMSPNTSQHPDPFDTSHTQFNRQSSVILTPTGHPPPAYPMGVRPRLSHVEFRDAFGRQDSSSGTVVQQHQFQHPAGYQPNVVYVGQQQQTGIPTVNATLSGGTMGRPVESSVSPQQMGVNAGGATEPKKKKKYYGKKKPTVDGAGNVGCRTMTTTTCPASNLLAMAIDFEPDVVMAVSYLLDKTGEELDGPSGIAAAERENVLLKRLLDSASPAGTSGSEDKKKMKPKEVLPAKRTASFGTGQQASPKKRQRKTGPSGNGAAANSKAKTTLTPNQATADTNAVFLEQLAIQLKTLPVLPVQEPAPKSDSLISNLFGVTQLVQKAEKRFITGSRSGNLRLTFMPDYYLDVFDRPGRQDTQQQRLPNSDIHQQSTTQRVPSSFNGGYDIGNASSAKQVTSQQLTVQQQFQSRFLVRQQSTSGMETMEGGRPQGLPQYVYHGQSSAAFGSAGEPELRSFADSPLEVIYSETPEVEEDVLPTYPALKPVLPAEGRLSPNFRLVAPVPMRAVPADPPTLFNEVPQVAQPTKKPSMSPRHDDSDSVNVTLTLDFDAAHRVHDVLRGLAALLQIEVPQQFEMHIDTPPTTPEKDDQKPPLMTQVMPEQHNPVFCRNCEATVKQACVRKKLAELGLTPKDDDVDEVIFCSQPCYDHFANGLKNTSSGGRPTEHEEPGNAVDEDKAKLNSTDTSKLAPVASINKQEPAAPARPAESEESRLDEIIKSVLGDNIAPSAPVYTSKEEVIHVKDLPRFKDFTGNEDGNKTQVYEKRWKGTKWKSWSLAVGNGVMTVATQSVDAMYAEISKILFRPTILPNDVRVCDFCASVGDGPVESSGRLLNLDAGRWVHVNCALWSPEVYERVEGALVNVEQAVRRASGHVCCRCQRYGASVQCFKLRCDRTFHLPCAVESGCTFLENKTMLCPSHASGTGADVVLTSLAVIRRVYVERDENRIIAKLYQQGDSGELALRVGSLIFGHVGQLLPHQLRDFHVKDYIYPVGYTASRIYWSAKDVRKRNIYICTISDKDGQPEFNVAFNEKEFADVTYSDTSASGAWAGILQPLEQLRVEAGMLKLFANYLPGEALFGLTESAIVKMIESLPGVDMMLRYECKYGRSPLIDLPLAVNPSGCARCEPRFRTYIKRSHTHTASTAGSLQSLLALSGLTTELAFYQYGGGGGGGGNRQSLVSKWSQYRKMKQEWQNNVVLARSKIQGLGLYAKRDIEMNAMVIEYIGEVIRNEVAERREKLYQTHNRGIYMFRIDEERVIDATVSGGLARYINHSCDPNCVAELFEFDREPKIIIMTCRPITKGEEFTYDYQFDVEDESSKIPCMCGAPNCQKWLN